jgi:hypothetical protein
VTFLTVTSCCFLGLIMGVEFKPGWIDLDALKQCHADARAGWYAQAMANYAQHLATADHLANHRRLLREFAVPEQEKAAQKEPNCHPRHAEAVGELVAALRLFLQFAVEQDVLDREAAKAFLRKVRAQLHGLLKAGADIQSETDPAEVFIELLRALLASKRALLYDLHGQAPKGLQAACGWERTMVVDAGDSFGDWQPVSGAARIGWVDESFVYLNPDVAYAAVERLARETGRNMGTKRQVFARLADARKILVEDETPGQRRSFTPKVTVEGRRERLLHVHRELVLGDDVGQSPSLPNTF